MTQRGLAVTLLTTVLAGGLAGCDAGPRTVQSASTAPTAGAAAQIDFQKIIATAKRRVYPTLVFVKPIQETFESGERRRTEVFGSGVIVSADGYVVTNHHVAEKAIEVNCVLGDRVQVPATVVGLDPETDLALLKLKLEPNTPALSVAEFGDSDVVEEGQFAMALGSPFGFTRSISLGIVSNTRRYIGFTTQYQYNLWLQTDAAINPGNSGGPLVNTDGKVIGINTLGAGAEGIGFAIPSNVVADIVAKLLAASAKAEPNAGPVKVDRTHTGLLLQALNDFKSNTFTDSARGVLVQSVEKDSSAFLAGVRDGDLLLAVNGQAMDGLYVEDLPALRVLLAGLPADRPAGILLARKDADDGNEPTGPYAGAVGKRKLLTVAMRPVKRGQFEGESYDCKRWNMTVKELTKFSNPRLHFLQPSGGVFIQGVRARGNAADADLQPGDVVLKIGTAEIKTLADVEKAYKSLVDDPKRVEKKVLVTIKRDGFLDWKPLGWEKDYLKEE
jgi:serine protease Do